MARFTHCIFGLPDGDDCRTLSGGILLISKDVFSLLLIILIVFRSLLIPSSAKYSHCTGMITESAAVRELTVISP